MPQARPPIIDMTPDGRFATPPTGSGPGWPVKLGAMALLVAVSTGALAMAAVFLWLALWLVPVALIAGLVAWAAFRVQLWRMRRRPGSGRSARGLYRF